MRSLKCTLIFSLCLLGCLTIAPAFAQSDNVTKYQAIKKTVGLSFLTKSGLYPVGCRGEKIGQLTISPITLPKNALPAKIKAAQDDAADFHIKADEDGISGKTCGRGAILYAGILFTPHREGAERATLSVTKVTGDPSQFTDYFTPPSITLEEIGVAATSQKKNNPDPAAPEKTINIFVGGALDATTHIVYNYREQFHDLHPKLMSIYKNFGAGSEIESIIKELPPETKINLIGHSWGGDTVATIAIAHPGRVNLLITIDPVYHHPLKEDANTYYKHIKSAVAKWVDVDAIGGSIFDGGNILAGIGNDYGKGPSACLGYDFKAEEYTHGNFSGMMDHPLKEVGTAPVNILLDNN